MDEFFSAFANMLVGYFIGSAIGEWLFGGDDEDDTKTGRK